MPGAGASRLEWRTQAVRIDHEKDQVRLTLVDGVRGSSNLVRVAAVDETHFCECAVTCGDLIRAAPLGSLPLTRARDVVDQRHIERASFSID